MKAAILSFAFLVVAVSGYSMFDDGQSITLTTPACPPCECQTPTTVPPTTTIPTTTTTKATIAPDDYCHTCISSRCNPEGGIDYSVQLPYPGDCTRFCKCDKPNSALAFDCPAGLHFNKELQLCDWPTASRCSVQSTYEGGCESLLSL